MNDSSRPPAPAPPGRSDDWITFAHELDLPHAPDFVSLPPRVSLDEVLDLCEETLARIPAATILAQPDREQWQVEFML